MSIVDSSVVSHSILDEFRRVNLYFRWYKQKTKLGPKHHKMRKIELKNISFSYLDEKIPKKKKIKNKNWVCARKRKIILFTLCYFCKVTKKKKILVDFFWGDIPLMIYTFFILTITEAVCWSWKWNVINWWCYSIWSNFSGIHMKGDYIYLTLTLWLF